MRYLGTRITRKGLKGTGIVWTTEVLEWANHTRRKAQIRVRRADDWWWRNLKARSNWDLRQTASIHFEFSQQGILFHWLLHIFLKFLPLLEINIESIQNCFFFLPIVDKRRDKLVCAHNHNSKETGIKRHVGIYASTYIISRWKWFDRLDRKRLSESQVKTKDRKW